MTKFSHIKYGPNNPPPDTCSTCDREIVIDEPPTCRWTGRHCDSGCDCGTTYATVCVDCGGSYELVEPCEHVYITYTVRDWRDTGIAPGTHCENCGYEPPEQEEVE